MGLTTKFYEISMPAVLLIVVILVALWIVGMTRSPNIDFNAMRLLMSKQPDGTWKESRRAIGELTAIVVSTWGFVYMVLADKLTEWYMAGWLGILLGWSIAKKVSEAKNVQDLTK